MLSFRQWNDQTLEEAYSALIDDLPLNPSAPGGMIQYRRSLTLRYCYILYKIHITVGSTLTFMGCASWSVFGLAGHASQWLTLMPLTQVY
jgi:hypothetical protein